MSLWCCLVLTLDYRRDRPKPRKFCSPWSVLSLRLLTSVNRRTIPLGTRRSRSGLYAYIVVVKVCRDVSSLSRRPSTLLRLRHRGDGVTEDVRPSKPCPVEIEVETGPRSYHPRHFRSFT